MVLYTNKEGVNRHERGLKFWAWTERDVYEKEYADTSVEFFEMENKEDYYK